MNGSRLTNAIWVMTLIVVGAVATGCGVNVAGGGTPKQQPVPQTNPSVPSSSSPAGGGNKQPASKTTATGAGTKNGGSAAKNAGSGTNPTKPVTIKVTSSPLALLPVNQGGEGSFVPVSNSVQSILAPAGWKVQSDSAGSQATIIRMMSPTDPSQVINEVVQDSQRDLQGFYSQMAAGSAKWWVTGKVVRFTIQNPNSPYLDQGIAANLQGGGSIRVDIYLPAAQSAEASQILHSFVTQALSPSSTSTTGG